jgi:hypothetical protein
MICDNKTEITMANNLPYWYVQNTGPSQSSNDEDNGYNPDWQIRKLRAACHTIPTFTISTSTLPTGVRSSNEVYYEPLWTYAKNNKIPVNFIGGNLLDMFKFEPWASMTGNHPFVETTGGTIHREWLSPWNNNSSGWLEIGKLLGTFLTNEFASDYPDVPSIYISDLNSSGLATPSGARLDEAFPSYLTSGNNDSQFFERQKWDGYRLRRALITRGVKRTCPKWADKIKIFTHAQMGNEFCVTGSVPNGMEFRFPWSSPSGTLDFYGFNASVHVGCIPSGTSYNVNSIRSPQVEACNVRYAYEEFSRSNDKGFKTETQFYNGKTESITPEQWLGAVRCVLWIMRSERNKVMVPEGQTVSDTYITQVKPVVDAIEEVWDNNILIDFWRSGTLVRNTWSRSFDDFPAINSGDTQTASGHPYYWENVAPAEEKDPGRRWYLQHVPTNNRLVAWNTVGGSDARGWDNWKNDTAHTGIIGVYAIALKKANDYLIYAHSPDSAQTGVQIQICPTGYDPVFSITVDVPVSGKFWTYDSSGVLQAL